MILASGLIAIDTRMGSRGKVRLMSIVQGEVRVKLLGRVDRRGMKEVKAAREEADRLQTDIQIRRDSLESRKVLSHSCTLWKSIAYLRFLVFLLQLDLPGVSSTRARRWTVLSTGVTLKGRGLETAITIADLMRVAGERFLA